MPSRVSSVSSVSSISSVERRTQDSHHFLHTPPVAVSAHDAQQPRIDQRAAVDQVDETVTAQPLLPRHNPGQREEMTADYEMKDPFQIRQRPHGKRSWYYDWWFWEIAGALLSLASTVAIILMLAAYNNKPLELVEAGITLNAVLSVLSTVAKASLRIHPSVRIDQQCQ